MVRDGWRGKALIEVSAAKAREERERRAWVLGEAQRWEQCGKGRGWGGLHDRVGEKIPRGWGKKKKQPEIPYPVFSHSSLASAWTMAYAGDTRQERAEHGLKGDGRGWQPHSTSRSELDLAWSSPFPSSQSGASMG